MSIFPAFLLCLCLLEPLEVRGSGDGTSFYDCQVYSDLKDLPTEKFDYVYDYTDNLYYSKTWECEAPPCPPEEQVTSEGESCPVCPDTCTTGGKIYRAGEVVTCGDGINTCRCVGTGVAMSTLIGTNKFSLCGAPLPWE